MGRWQAGDWVWARDEVTGEVWLCEVEETYRNESPVIQEVTAGGETLATTPGHPFWVLEVGWKDAGDLEVGDRLVNLRGESVVVEDIRRRPVPEAVYNFSVAGLHTYFVGQGGIWVHNNSATGCGVGGGGTKAPAEVFRKGSATDANLTPRPVDKGGLSTTIKPPPGKSQVIDPARLNQLEAVQDGADHASIRPIDRSRMQEWIDSKGAETAHEFTEELRNAIIRTEKR